MLRYILLKLPGFTSKTDYSISSKSNQLRLLTPLSPVKREARSSAKKSDGTRLYHKRSYSFPTCKPKSNSVIDRTQQLYGTWTSTDLQDCEEVIQKKGNHQRGKKCIKKIPNNTLDSREHSTQSKKARADKSASRNKEVDKLQGDQSYQIIDQYELEAARPRRSQSELLFNVFDYIPNDPMRYLQPNKQRPFGSTDNSYLPLLMDARPTNLTQFNVPSVQNPEYPKASEKNVTPSSENSSMKAKEQTAPIADYYYQKKRKDYSSKENATYNELNQNHKDLNPSYISKKLSPKVDEQALIDEATEIVDKYKTTFSNPKSSNKSNKKTLDEPPVREIMAENKNNVFESYRLRWNEPGIKIEPPPFLNSADACPNMDCEYMEKASKPASDHKCLQVPWPAYSERIKENLEKTLPEQPVATENVICSDVSGLRGKNQTNTIQERMPKVKLLHMERGNLHSSATISPRKALSNNSIDIDHEMQIRNESNTSKSSVYVTKSCNKRPVSANPLSVSNRKMYTSSSRTYAGPGSSERKSRAFEPPSCAKEEEPKKCFLPSKVRLWPPHCLSKPAYRECNIEEPCAPRADQCYAVVPKKLPVIQVNKCPCVEPHVPAKNPKMRRLKFQFLDPPPRVCPCKVCPCPPRADDSREEKKKKLPQYKPGNCECIEPPPMQDVPLVRLKKLCEPEEKCYPKAECPKPEICDRADENRVELVKVLPAIQSGNCPCVEPYVPDKNPKMQRLKMVFKDPERVCPCNICPCPPRADDSLKQKIKKLPIYKPGFCECIEPPKMKEVPLKRLVKVCPPEACKPQKECPVDDCDVKSRADYCLKEMPKKLPILKVSTQCVCIEPEVPHKNPKMKRLKMEFKDKPRKLCEPPTCAPRADDTLQPKMRKLPIYAPGNCKCIEPPPMVDVPLIKLKKICEPEEKCYPPVECPKPELCKDKPRADDNICVRAKTLPHLKPKSCPCVEPPPIIDVPKLKRLDLRVPEPVKYCPKTSCADFSRADDSLKEKNRKLPLLKAGDCPCIEQPMVDVKPLPRLKCQDEGEPCVCDDPCIPFPRADWGCWEYTQDIGENVNKCKKSAMKKKKVSVNTKRRYNTDTKVNFCSKTKPENKKKNEADKLSVNKILDENSFKDDLQLKPLNVNKVINKGFKGESKSRTNIKLSEPEGPNDVYDSSKKSLNLKVTSQLGPNKSKSQPTLKLLKQLNNLEKSNSDSNIHQDNNAYLKKILNNISISTSLEKPILNTNIRKLSTDAIRRENSVRQISSGNVNCSSKKGKKCNIKKPKKCKLDKCEKTVQKNCPRKEDRTCTRERIPVCCEKKATPFPAFSECMDEEVEPYTKKVTQWTCNRRQYGFEPKHKRSDDGAKNKKNYSTTSDTSYQFTKATKVMKIQDGHRGLQLNSSHILCPRRTRSTSRINFSTSNPINIKDVSYQFPRYESSFQDHPGKKGKKKDCKKRKCPKFPASNCPQKGRQTCVLTHDYGRCKKQISPYPAFSDCMDDELAEGINECPLERDKIELLQPKRPMDKPKLVDPITPNQGLIDPKVEEDCLRAKHCLKREGISQCCGEFGKKIKPLKSRDFPRKKDKDCDRIEELKKLGRWPPTDFRRFSTCTNSNFIIHRREYSTLGRTLSATCNWEQNKEYNLRRINSVQVYTKKAENSCVTYDQEYDNTKTYRSKGLYVRNYHVLCNNAKRNVVDDVDRRIKNTPQNQLTDIDEPCKYMKLRNVQWRINNFQKWRRLNKLSSLQDHVKEYHTCSKLKYRRFIKYPPTRRNFSTTQFKNISEFSDLYALRGISTTMILGKQGSNYSFGKRDKNAFSPKHCNIKKDCPKFKLPNCPSRERFICKRKRVDTPCEKVITPYPAFSECHDEEMRNTIMECPLGKERIQRLQPQYPLVPEIETVNLPPPPYQGGIDPNLEIDYVRHKLGLENEGVTQDCESFGQPIKYLKCKNIAGFSSIKPKAIPKDKSRVRKKKARENYRKRAERPCIPKERACPEVITCKPDRPKCYSPPKQVCELTLWQKLVNYFKARPNCPAPDEWKKRALREKAEKAAKAAGLCLVDPKEMAKNECRESDDLPKVITPQSSECEYEQNHKDQQCASGCTFNKKNTTDSCASNTNRRQFCTFSKRHYSQNVNWKYFEEFNKLVEEEQNKGRVEEPFTSVLENTNSLNDISSNKDDDVLRSPDPYCLKVFNEAILNKDKLNDITKYVDIDIKDEPINYSLQILTKNKEFMDIIFNEPVDEFTNYSQAKAIAAFQEYVTKMDTLPEISYEDIENSKTNNLINELNKLLANKEE